LSRSPAAAGGGARALPGQVRIIGGIYKRTPIPVAQRPGLRPTPDRVRETLFNWLGQDLSGWQVVDVFAGTGALAFEAASRGAARVSAFEQDAQLVGRIEALRNKLGAQALSVVCGNGLSLLRALPAGQVHLVLIDPPFESGLFVPALQAAVPVLAEQGVIYLEAPVTWTAADLRALGLRLLRQGRAGAVHFHLLGRIDAA
jgi:16S rRNA (guanine(966)-N(2))-methyltransferase RsmD